MNAPTEIFVHFVNLIHPVKVTQEKRGDYYENVFHLHAPVPLSDIHFRVAARAFELLGMAAERNEGVNGYTYDTDFSNGIVCAAKTAEIANEMFDEWRRTGKAA